MPYLNGLENLVSIYDAHRFMWRDVVFVIKQPLNFVNYLTGEGWILSQEILCWNRKIIFPLGERALTIARDFTFGMRVKTAFHSMGRIYYPTRFCTLHTHPVYIAKICIFAGWRPIPLQITLPYRLCCIWALIVPLTVTECYLIVLQTFFVMIVLGESSKTPQQ